MTDPRELTKTYEPNLLLQAVFRRFFDGIQIEEDWAEQVRRLSQRGTVIYVLRNLNWLDFFALDHLTKRHALPRIRFANDLRLWVLNPMGKGWLNAILPRAGVTVADELRDAIQHNGSAALFLKRPPGVLDWVAGSRGGRGRKEGDELIYALFELQRASDKPILLLPQLILWTKQPDTRGTRALDFVLGPREWPSPVRTIGQYLTNHKHVALKSGEPLDLREFFESSAGVPDEVQVRRLTYAILRRLERERRSVTGPARKSPERVRMELLRSPKLRSTVDDLAGGRPEDRYALAMKALGMLQKLQATPDMATVRAMEAALDRMFNRIYAGIEYDKQDIQRLREACRNGTLVLLPSHKSHVDYLVLSYIFNQENLPLPFIAAGDNLDFFPMGGVFRRAGAFFIRRSFKGDRLYSAVVDAYIRRLMRDGHTLELFLEGGRSRTGKLLAPKFGLLSMVVDAALAVPQQATSFAPVSIGYERVIEAASYERELTGHDKQKEDAAGLLKSTGVLRHRYGRLNMQVGTIVSLADLRRELGLPESGALTPAKRRALVIRLGNRVMDEINRVTAVTPGALTALALLSHRRRGLSHAELIDHCEKLLRVLRDERARCAPSTVTPSGSLRPDAIREAVQMFVDTELVEAHEPAEPIPSRPSRRRRGYSGAQTIYTIPDEKRLAIDTSKNMIVHFFVERSLVAAAVAAEPSARAPLGGVRARVQEASRLLKYEFRFQAAPFDEIFEATVAAMLAEGTLQQRDVTDGEPELSAGPGRDGWSGAQWLSLYASILQNFLEGYRVAARSVAALVRGPLSYKELTKRALAMGNRMFYAGEIERLEAVSKPILENAYLAFVDERFLKHSDGKLELTEEYRSVEAAQLIETKVRGVLGPSGTPGASAADA